MNTITQQQQSQEQPKESLTDHVSPEQVAWSVKQYQASLSTVREILSMDHKNLDPSATTHLAWLAATVSTTGALAESNIYTDFHADLSNDVQAGVKARAAIASRAYGTEPAQDDIKTLEKAVTLLENNQKFRQAGPEQGASDWYKPQDDYLEKVKHTSLRFISLLNKARTAQKEFDAAEVKEPHREKVSMSQNQLARYRDEMFNETYLADVQSHLDRQEKAVLAAQDAGLLGVANALASDLTERYEIAITVYLDRTHQRMPETLTSSFQESSMADQLLNVSLSQLRAALPPRDIQKSNEGNG